MFDLHVPFREAVACIDKLCTPIFHCHSIPVAGLRRSRGAPTSLRWCTLLGSFPCVFHLEVLILEAGACIDKLCMPIFHCRRCLLLPLLITRSAFGIFFIFPHWPLRGRIYNFVLRGFKGQPKTRSYRGRIFTCSWCRARCHAQSFECVGPNLGGSFRK